jgi:hypothetical protein
MRESFVVQYSLVHDPEVLVEGLQLVLPAAMDLTFFELTVVDHGCVFISGVTLVPTFVDRALVGGMSVVLDC